MSGNASTGKLPGTVTNPPHFRLQPNAAIPARNTCAGEAIVIRLSAAPAPVVSEIGTNRPMPRLRCASVAEPKAENGKIGGRILCRAREAFASVTLCPQKDESGATLKSRSSNQVSHSSTFTFLFRLKPADLRPATQAVSSKCPADLRTNRSGASRLRAGRFPPALEVQPDTFTLKGRMGKSRVGECVIQER